MAEANVEERVVRVIEVVFAPVVDSIQRQVDVLRESQAILTTQYAERFRKLSDRVEALEKLVNP